MTRAELEAGGAHATNNRDALARSASCRCFCCGDRYPARDVSEWIDGDTTAVCPVCGVDSVVGDASVPDLSDAWYTAMEAHWFGIRDLEKTLEG